MSDNEAAVAAEYNRLRGRLCGLVESWGMPDRQERAMISTLKSLTYDSEALVKEMVEDR